MIDFDFTECYLPKTLSIQVIIEILLRNIFSVFSDGPLFPLDHELSLRAEGLERPRRKRGRPAKQIASAEVESDHKIKEDHDNKTFEESEEGTEGTDCRRRRKIRRPAKFAELVQVNLRKKFIINNISCLLEIISLYME